MARLRLLVLLAVAVFALAAGGSCAFEFEVATIDNVLVGFMNGSLTSTALVRYYLDHITRLNPLLHAVRPCAPMPRGRLASAERPPGSTASRC